VKIPHQKIIEDKNFEPIFRVYSFLDKEFHYFDLEDGYPSGIAGGVSEPQVYAQFRDVLTDKLIFVGDIVGIFLNGNRFHDPVDWLGRYEVVFSRGKFMLRVIEKNWTDTYCTTEEEAKKLTTDPNCPHMTCLYRPLCQATVVGDIFQHLD
jgi:hypothetical protein